MKTDDLIQLGALGLIAYLAYQKFGQAKSPSTSIPTVPVQPSVQIPSPDFGVTNPSDTTWGDSSLPADFGLQNVIDWATET
jgi:hypothetical protein